MTICPPQLRERLEAAGQEHALAFWDRLGDEKRLALQRDLEAVDLEQMRRLHDLACADSPQRPSMVEPIPQITRGEHAQADDDARAVGEDLLREGRVAAFVVAGGQGTRLGHEGPKGTYPATPVRGCPLFQVFAEKVCALERRYGHPVPFYVMTSPSNHEATTSFFDKNENFGLDAAHLRFFSQGTMPALDQDGRLVLDAPHRLFRSPDGHGGSLRALATSGALEDMKTRGIEEIFYFQVDNPLVEMCDPMFLGYHRSTGSAFSSKSVPKRDPEEKVGVLCLSDGKPSVIEYSDLSEDLRNERDAEGRLRFRAGNIAIHIISRSFVEGITGEGAFRLPFHVARKEVPTIDSDGTPGHTPGFKFETFVFDGLPLANGVMVFEVDRETDFSPIKNREGADSPSSSRRDQTELFSTWLDAVGVDVPRGASGDSEHAIEISPLFADGIDSLRGRIDDLPQRVEGDLVLD